MSVSSPADMAPSTRIAAPSQQKPSGPSSAATKGSLGIVTALQNLNTEAARLVYSRLNPNEIRVAITHAGSGDDPIRCFVNAVSVEELPEYEALSYVCKCSRHIASRAETDVYSILGGAKIVQSV
jgi:hypothetical protein